MVADSGGEAQVRLRVDPGAGRTLREHTEPAPVACCRLLSTFGSVGSAGAAVNRWGEVGLGRDRESAADVSLDGEDGHDG